MDRQDYESARQQLEQKLDRARSKVAELESAIEGLDAAWKVLGGARSKSASGSRGQVANAVRQILPRLHGPFSIQDIVQEAERQNPDTVLNRTSVNSVLNTLLESGEIEKIQDSKGPHPAKYQQAQRAEQSSMRLAE